MMIIRQYKVRLAVAVLFMTAVSVLSGSHLLSISSVELTGSPWVTGPVAGNPLNTGSATGVPWIDKTNDGAVKTEVSQLGSPWVNGPVAYDPWGTKSSGDV
ncbi:MAG: hypothetical protein AAF702_41900 [Chloroflexota bacterium]